jgi:FtsP/CotA-like multicopper oxidase with cupredoxin domain
MAGDGLRFSRRGFIGAGAALVAGASLSKVPWTPSVPVAFAAGPPLIQPQVLESSHGLLTVDLEAKITTGVTVGGVSRNPWVYNGQFPAPTFKLKPGDRLRLKLKNSLAVETNLHTHGLHVAPEGISDNVLLHVDPGDTQQYEINIPKDHSGGMNWYHPHPHGLGLQQLFGGMAGAIIIAGGLDSIKEIGKLPDRIMVIQAPAFDGGGNVKTITAGGGPSGIIHLVNGQDNPTVTVRQGRRERWRLLNATVKEIYEIALVGHSFQLIATDGNPFDKPQTVNSFTLAPGQRVEVVVTPGAPGTYDLNRTVLFPAGGTPTPLATVVVQSASPSNEKPVPGKLIPFQDLRKAKVDRKRTITFSSTGTTFKIDVGEGAGAQVFDPNRVDQVIELGSVEEWTIVNDDGKPHPFHIHTNPFQVTKINGQNVTAHGLRDTELLPANSGESMTFRTRFRDFTGLTVFHCHLIPHADNGMMSLFRIDLPTAGGPGAPIAQVRGDLTPIRWDGTSPTFNPSDGTSLASAFNPSDGTSLASDYNCKIPGSAPTPKPSLDGWTSSPSRFENS